MFNAIKDDSKKVVEVVADLLTDYKYIYPRAPNVSTVLQISFN